jgi:WD40 repeat protein
MLGMQKASPSTASCNHNANISSTRLLQQQEQQQHPSTTAILYSEDVLRIIFDWVSLAELATCARVCRGWGDFLDRDDDILWTWKAQSTYWDNHTTTKTQLRKRISDNRQLASHLEAGNFVRDCGQRSWLLVGHSKPVMDMIVLGKDDEFAVTFGEDGELRSWKLPIEDTMNNRPPSTLLWELESYCSHSRSSYVPGGIEWIHDKETSTSRAIIAGRKQIFAVELRVVAVVVTSNTNNDDDNTTDDTTTTDTKQEKKLKCRYLQASDDELDHYMTCTCLDLHPSSNQHLWITGSSDSNIRVYNVENDDKDGTLVDEEKTPMLLQGHSGCVHGIALVGDGNDDDTNLLYSRSSDQTVRIWNPTTGECLRTISFDGAIGGVGFLGFRRSRNQMAVLFDSLEGCAVRICHAVDGSLVQEITNDSSRITATHLYEQSLLCGTADGSVVAFDLRDGSQMHSFGQLMGSYVTSVVWLVKDRWILAVASDGEMCLIRAASQDSLADSKTEQQQQQQQQQQADDRIARRIQLRFINPGGMVYCDRAKTLLVASSGYLVRAFVFSPPSEKPK